MIVRNFLTSPFKVFAIVIAMSTIALGAAIGSQLFGGLEPCIMCQYQRIPFVLAILLGLFGLLMRNNAGAVKSIMALCALAFLINTGLAIYHSGIELKWWESAVEGCKVPMGDEGQSTQEWLAQIMKTPAVPCTDIQWKDPVLGLTMANYNIVLNLLLFALCVAGLIRQRPSGTARQTQP